VPLLAALEAGQLEATRVLLLLGALSEFAGPDERDLLNYIPLDRFDLVWAIVTHERESTEPKRAARALHFAARRNNLLFAEELLRRGVAVDGRAVWSRGTPLMTAVQAANCVWEREHKPNPNATYPDSLQGDYLEMIALLLRYGADVNAEDGEAMRDAARFGNTPLIRLLRQHGATYTISAAAMLGDTNGVLGFVESGADIETPTTLDEPSDTPLMEAASRGHAETLAYLLRRGANVRPCVGKEYDWWQPLTQAVGMGSYDCVALLCDYGAATDNVDALNRAIESGDEQMVRLLLRGGAPTIGTDYCGRTPLEVAAEHGHDGMTRLLWAQSGVV
jgi:ankyrin repeat protein